MELDKIEKIVDINHMTNLKKLILISSFSIDNDGIKDLTNIEYLKIFGNKKIDNINHMTKIEVLKLSNSVIDNSGIQNINPRVLELDNYTEKITDISHMNNVRELGFNEMYCRTFRKIDGINPEILKLKAIHSPYNFNHMTNVKELHIIRAVDDSAINNLNPEILKISDIYRKINIERITNLKKIEIYDICNPESKRYYDSFLKYNRNIISILKY